METCYLFPFFFLNKEKNSKTPASIYVEYSAQPVQSSLILNFFPKAVCGEDRTIQCQTSALPGWLAACGCWEQPELGALPNTVFGPLLSIPLNHLVSFPGFYSDAGGWLTLFVMLLLTLSILEDVQNLGFSFYKIILNLIKKCQGWTLSAMNHRPCLQCLYRENAGGSNTKHSQLRLWML